eukprot:4620524-Pyramimonas_sp.AAC.1
MKDLGSREAGRRKGTMRCMQCWRHHCRNLSTHLRSARTMSKMWSDPFWSGPWSLPKNHTLAWKMRSSFSMRFASQRRQARRRGPGGEARRQRHPVGRRKVPA